MNAIIIIIIIITTVIITIVFFLLLLCLLYFTYLFILLFIYPHPQYPVTLTHIYIHTHTLISTHTNHVGCHVCFIDLGYFVFDLSPVNSMFVCIIKKKKKCKYYSLLVTPFKSNIVTLLITFWQQ